MYDSACHLKRDHFDFGKACIPHTVDGRNPANQLMGWLSHYLQGLFYISGGCLGFLPTVC